MSVERTDLILPAERTERARPYSAPALMGGDGAMVMQIIERMMREATFDPVAIREMLAIKKEYEADEARKAYMDAMADFKKTAPVFHKTKHVDYGNGKAKFDYAPIAEVVAKLAPALAAHGLTHHWIPKSANGLVSVQCMLTHKFGHSDSVESLPVAVNANPALSPSQNMQATITFWQRMTLQWITGTAAGDVPDVDNGPAESQYIGEGQIANIEALLTETGANRESFLKYIKAPSIDKIYLGAYDVCISILEGKRNKS